MAGFIDLTNQRFGRLLVKYRSLENTSQKKPQWVCNCDCGEQCTVAASRLRDGTGVSCGCHYKPNLVDQKFGRLTVLSRHEENTKHSDAQWICKCSCGNPNIIIISSSNLRSGNTTSCGCHRKEVLLKSITKHGLRYVPEYKIWLGMIQRCHNSNTEHYSDYGGRGITVSTEWRDSFEVFYKDMGARPTPNHSIDRRENDKGYYKENCRWATPTEQANNRRNNIFYTYREETKTLPEWCRKLNLNYAKIYSRIHVHGWSFEEAILPIASKFIKFDGDNKTIEDWCGLMGLDREETCLRILRGELFENIVKE